ncbi:coiled-coil domain-containing protein 66 isoform X1 [Seriola aureovittata]|uniref:coiled-coil domain-containing protein 66 isoform X1 n=1 Tax=Seriola aureovittata TaxID=2871759 RepID=UPI0024BE5559|nr:coiled-coil domain-containing protein 66 isoform X1 [Seriola aureovittata]XP_056243636.1 coiled-coil domain-containing protein 66 isoform X1 [Seriola aureovittata]XP_056243644.1 coiled-coil domain-containing protein 66 isoform X1 [Seriola aureovittata]
MNLGDGLLFELENGKPRLILLSHGVEKNPAKTQQLSIRPRAANILSSRQPSCVEEVQVEERPARPQAGRHKEAKTKAGRAAANTPTTGGRSTTLISSKTHEHHNGGGIKAVAKVKSDRHKHGSTVGSLRANGKTGQPQNSGTQADGKAGLKDTLASGGAGLKDSMVVLTSEQLQKILHTVQTSSNGEQPGKDHRTQGSGSDGSKSGTSLHEGGRGGEMKEADRGGGGAEEGIKEDGGGGVTDTTGTSQDKDNRLSGCLFSWLEEGQSGGRSAIDAKKAQWRRELDKQVALKQQQQQRSASGRLQAEEDTESVLSVQSSVSHREQPSAIRSSLKLGEVTPVEELLSVGRREEQRRRWLEELDQQREETTERRRREKLLQNQAEDHELWATHFDSLQRRAPVHSAAPSAPPPAPSSTSERGDWEPSSSLSLVWEAMSSCGAESAGRASVDTTSGHPSRASYLRTMTALLDPTQIEEREKRRLKQLEQQRAIEAQMEERRRQKEQERARRREEEEDEEKRVALEREMLQRQYELDTLRERQKPSHPAEEPKKGPDDDRLQETLEPSAVTRQAEHLEEEVSSSVSPYKDTAVQTEAAPSLPLGADDVSAQYQPPPSLSAAPPNSRNRAVSTGKENICLPRGAGADPYEAFARMDRSRREKRRPEWNTQRPSRRFVPASERYPAALQRNRQESRLKRQAELLALQERTCQSRTDPPPPPLSEHHAPRHCSNNTRTRTSPNSKGETVSRGQSISAATNSERGRSPPVPAVRLRVQTQQASGPLPPPALEYIPYVRTDEVFNLDPLESADTPPPHSHTEAPPQTSVSPPSPSRQDPLLHPELLHKTHTHRQQEILRGLAQLRQGLLQKQRELEADLNPLLKHQDKEVPSPSATHRM